MHCIFSVPLRLTLLLIGSALLIGNAVSANAHEGGWSSGGGELLKDARNPWFLPANDEVKYCVVIDENKFGTNRTQAEAAIQRALRFWKIEFASAVLPVLPHFGPLKIAAQKFRSTACDSTTDIQFQMGVLSAPQLKFLRHPSQYAAIAVRTHYDEVRMRGKGFVYVAPVHGPHAFLGAGVNAGAWSKDSGELLYLTLVHELGHVFGLAHSGTYGDLMSEGYVESLLSAPSDSASKRGTPRFFSFAETTSLICPGVAVREIWTDYFDAPKSTNCFRFQLSAQKDPSPFHPSELTVFARKSAQDPEVEVGRATLSTAGFFPLYTSLIWLPPKQTVFTPADLARQSPLGVVGISLFQISKQGILATHSGHRKQLLIRQVQGRQNFSMTGVNATGEILELL